MSFSWHKSLIYILCLSLLLTSVPLNHAHALSTSDKWEEVKDNFDLMVFSRKDADFAELYYRIETRLSDSQKEEFAILNKNLKYKMAKYKVPKALVTADTLTLKDAGQELVIKVQKDEEGELFLSVNGRKFTEDEAISPLTTVEILKKMSAPPAESKAALLWNILMPQAHAFSWGLILSGVAAVGTIGYLLYSKAKKKKKAAAAARCENKAAVCCNVSGTYSALTNGCCTEIGGISLGSGTCPTFITPEPTTESSSSGVQ